MIKLRLFLIPIILLGLNACASRPDSQLSSSITKVSAEQRTKEIQALKQWKTRGKIAFIQGKDRESASFYWRNNTGEKTQELNLTTFLGINIFSLESRQGIHQIEVDGKNYQSDDLANLLYALTNLQLPVEQLHFWMFGLPAYASDQVSFDPSTNLPIALNSLHNGKQWAINYAKYQRNGAIDVPSKITIRQGDLLIKMQISDWTF